MARRRGRGRAPPRYCRGLGGVKQDGRTFWPPSSGLAESPIAGPRSPGNSFRSNSFTHGLPLAYQAVQFRFLSVLRSHIGPSMRRRLHRTLMVCSAFRAPRRPRPRRRSFLPRELAELEAWYRRTTERTPGGQWGISIGTMDGRMLWSVSPELELIPASTTKLFTTGFSRTRMGGGARFTTRVIGDGRLDTVSGKLGRHLGARAGRRPDARPRRPRRPDAPRAGPPAPRARRAGARGPARAHQQDRSRRLALSRRSGRPTSRASSTPRRSVRWRCTRTPSRSPSARAARSARRRSW